MDHDLPLETLRSYLKIQSPALLEKMANFEFYLEKYQYLGTLENEVTSAFYGNIEDICNGSLFYVLNFHDWNLDKSHPDWKIAVVDLTSSLRELLKRLKHASTADQEMVAEHYAQFSS